MALGVSATLLLLVGCSRPQGATLKPWDARAAAVYLDQREVAWRNWPGAARDHGTFCVSCHTVMPYALSRPALRSTLAENGPSSEERALLDSITRRVTLWNQVEPFYTDQYRDGKARESRGTEAVLNALVLSAEGAAHDAQTRSLQDVTRAAFRIMWETQDTQGPNAGSWPWLQFNMEPWEASDSRYYGAALAAIAVGMAGENYQLDSGDQQRVKLLTDYLIRNYAQQSLMNRVVLLWASAELPVLMDREQRKKIIAEIKNAQQSDGGWRLSTLTWPDDWSLHSFAREHLRADWTRQSSSSDGYATGLIVFTLQKIGIVSNDPTMRRGLAWLAANQNKQDGSWPSFSVNERRNPTSNVGHFMTDAATAYSVLALAQSEAAAGRSHAPVQHLATSTPMATKAPQQ